MNTKDNVYKTLAVYGVQEGNEIPPDYLRRNVMAAIGQVAGQRFVENRQAASKAYFSALSVDEARPADKAVG